MKIARGGLYKNAQADFYKGKMVDIGDQVTNIDGNDFVELVVQDPHYDRSDKYYMIKKSDRDKFFKWAPEEVVQCKSFGLLDEMNEFLRTINLDKIGSCGGLVKIELQDYSKYLGNYEIKVEEKDESYEKNKYLCNLLEKNFKYHNRMVAMRAVLDKHNLMGEVEELLKGIGLK